MIGPTVNTILEAELMLNHAFYNMYSQMICNLDRRFWRTKNYMLQTAYQPNGPVCINAK